MAAGTNVFSPQGDSSRQNFLQGSVSRASAVVWAGGHLVRIGLLIYLGKNCVPLALSPVKVLSFNFLQRINQNKSMLLPRCNHSSSSACPRGLGPVFLP